MSPPTLLGGIAVFLIVVGGLIVFLSWPGERAYYGTIQPRNGAFATVEGAQGGTLVVHARAPNGSEVFVAVWTEEAFRDQYSGGLCSDPRAPCAQGPVAQSNGTEVNLTVTLPQTRAYTVAVMNYEDGDIYVTFEIRRDYFHPFGFVGGAMIAAGAGLVFLMWRGWGADPKERSKASR